MTFSQHKVNKQHPTEQPQATIFITLTQSVHNMQHPNRQISIPLVTSVVH